MALFVHPLPESTNPLLLTQIGLNTEIIANTMALSNHIVKGNEKRTTQT